MILDECDSLILKGLLKNHRKSLTDLSKTTGLSRFAVKNRIRKLFKEGFILGPTVVLNPFLVGLKKTVFFEFKTNPHEPWLAEMLEKMQSCDILDGITGEYSLFGRFRMFDDAHFSRVLRMVDQAMSKSFSKKYRVVDAIRIYKEAGVPFTFEEEEEESTPNLDEVDLRILDVLLHQVEYVKDSRLLSTTKLSKLLRRFGVQISQPTVFKRLMRLEKKGVILGHTLMVNWFKLGFNAKFVVRTKVNPSAYDDVARNFLALMNEITDLYRTGEDYGLLAFLRVRDVSEYNSFLLKLYSSKDIIDTYTTLILEERKSVPLSFEKESYLDRF